MDRVRAVANVHKHEKLSGPKHPIRSDADVLVVRTMRFATMRLYQHVAAVVDALLSAGECPRWVRLGPSAMSAACLL